MISNHIFNQQSLFFYQDSKLDRLELILHTLILFHCFLYMTKILFELQLGISRITNFLEVVNIGAMMVAVVTKYVEFALKSKRQFNMADSTKYEHFHIFVSIEEINTLSLAICSIFFPFRII